MTETITNYNKALWTAVLAVQKKVSVLAKDEQNPFYKSQYLSLPGIIKALQPVLSANDLVVSQHPLSPGKVETIVIHAPTGDQIKSIIELPVKELTPQSAGSSISYARRYALMAIFNIAAEDDDGNVASGTAEAPRNATSAQPAPYRKPYTPTTPSVPIVYECNGCGEPIKSAKVVQFSMQKYGKKLCMNCQKEAVETTLDDNPLK